MLRRTATSRVLARGRRIGWDAAAAELVADPAATILADDGFHWRLRADSNFDLDLELLLIELRRQLLVGSDDMLADAWTQETITTIAQQALDNAFVWPVSEQERTVLAALSTRVPPIVQSGGSAGWTVVARLCMYRRPGQVFGNLPPASTAQWRATVPSPSFRSFLAEYLESRAREHALRSSLESVGSIREGSEPVAELYESHPYPRWVRLREEKFIPERDEMLQFFSREELSFLRGPFKILIAGCGTGYGAVHAARAFPQAQITAIDISRSSLSYAALMMEKYGVTNARLLRMDLMDLPRFGERFDVARCIGVLHHLPSPANGGAALAAAVRPGGILHISLYSTAARRELARLRAEFGFTPEISDDELRRLRHRVMLEDPQSVEERLPLRADFFDLDRCRDLLCHPLEHTFTVPELATLVGNWGLEFRGLERPSIVRSQYWTRYPPPDARRDWKAWERFERRHPDAFGSLYQIWCRKP
jgi:2-polyprenyl-3-methyl-5-hydroxy-6-metoxy-1,4-benzoquinol methylase